MLLLRSFTPPSPDVRFVSCLLFRRPTSMFLTLLFFFFFSSQLDLILKTDSTPLGSRSRSWSVWVKFQKHFRCSKLLPESVFLEAGGYQLLKTDFDSASSLKKKQKQNQFQTPP
ncbi:unnamed protein product [Cuscuta epithymum]|uniref:Secreted protein n=1 Tax=Cuscuta epithymum TaxID=186058 RepID=A0AAV0G8Q6_9ASTE|nr:unnamed protein product [Cuscuta epithymum]